MRDTYREWQMANLQNELFHILDALTGLDGITTARIVATTVGAVKHALGEPAQVEQRNGETVVIGYDGTPWTIQQILDHAG